MSNRSAISHKNAIRYLLSALCLLALLVGTVLVIHAAGEGEGVTYIYFDLAADNVTVNGNTYTGYVYQKLGDGSFTKVTVSGTLQANEAYYVYQSAGGAENPDGYFTADGEGNRTYTLPQRTAVKVGDRTWADYVTNNSDVEAVITAWNTHAPTAGRAAVPHTVTVKGKLTATMVIDSLWSSYDTGANTSRTSGGITFIPGTNNSQLTIKTKGDNRFGNVFYYNSTSNGNSFLIFDEYEAGASLTVANLKNGSKSNYWCAAIGGNDSGSDHANGLVFNGGTVFAGTNAADDCTAIGGGGNGYGGVTINGGRVTATVTSSGAAIGGGIGKTSNGGQADVVITGGEVYAYNFSCVSGYSQQGVKYIPSAAIGGGSSARQICSPCTVTITGGRVYAQSVGGTAIGGGSSADNSGGTATVTIGGDAYVEARSISGTIDGSHVDAGVSIGGGTGGAGPNKNGGDVTLTIKDNPTVVVGSIGGGKTISPSGNIGAATVNIQGGTIQGQIIMAAGSSSKCTFTMSGGTIDNSGRDATRFHFLQSDGGAIYMDDPQGVAQLSGGTVTGCSAINGGALYMTAGSFTLSDSGTVTSCSATENGGAVYMGGGTLTVSGGTLSNNEAQNGGGAYLADGTLYVLGGTVTENLAEINGGAFSVANGNYIMTGGSVIRNVAKTGDGGALYISSSKPNAEITVRSGHIMGNEAGKNGGAMGVYGLDGVHFTITIGSRTNHAGKDGCHAHTDGTSPDEACPIIEGNISQTSGGGIYLSGSLDALMNMYCLIERDNKVGEKGVSPSNFMKVEGGTLNISSHGEEGQEDYGNVVIDSSIHVTGGAVTITGTGHNPVFNRPVTVDVNPTLGSTFYDTRQEGDFRTIQYFENFQGSGLYTLVDNHGEAVHAVHAASMYVREGWAIAKWEMRTVDAEGNHIPTGRFFYAGDKVADEGDLIFYAVWEMVGYTVTFSPGQDVDDYYGSMAPQSFIYSEYKTLSPNGFVREGYVFVRWEVVGTFAPLFSEGFTDGQNVGKLTEEHRAVIQLSAVWVLCDHQDTSLYVLTVTEHTVTRQCPCLAYHETVSITGVDTVYNGDPHGTSFTHEYPSTNGKPIPSGQWSGLVILYTGTTKGGIPYESFEAPINAGDYTATVILEGDLKVSAAIIIHKANYPNPPPAPEYQKEEVDGKPIIRIYGPTEPTDAPYEYRFSWYVGTTPDSSGWQTWDPAVGLKWNLDELWTSYYVDVRFAGTDNYNPSMPVRGSSTIVYTGQISFEISSGTGMIRSEWKMSGDRDGITISLAPYTSEFESFYIYNVIPQISASVAGYTLPLYDRKINPDGTWEIQIHTIAPDGGQSVTVYVHLDGAERIVEVDASTAKDQVFTQIGQGASDVSVSRDSAYTVLFEIDHYKHYSAPSLSFDSPIPAGTTVILRDFGDLSYWYYRATAEISVIPLSDFIRMGTSGEEAEDHYSTGAQTSLSLQFVVDFSRCETAPTYSFIKTVFVATPEQPDGLPLGTETVPQVPETEEQISLLDTPTFNLSAGASDPTDPLTQSIRYDFAVSEAVGGGLSKWESMQGLLVVTPEDPSLLPPDARLRVVIGNATRTYPLVDGRFIVALPSAGSGTAYMTMLSEMAPNTDLRIECTVSMAASIIGTETTPSLTGLTNQTVSVVYEIRSTRMPTVHVEMLGTNPAYVDGVISPLKFSVTAEDMGDYTLRASLYVKNEKGVYQFTTQTMDLALTDGAFEGTMSLDSLIPTMEQKIGSLSLMIRIEVVDTSGRVVDYVPLYVILIDTRQ